ncbi:cytosine permease [Ideonella sp. B508-1]|uniref:purine-cytosine permease family protein n=1 Tax=Ideonella sp. B508-1 TaxID=137716 RepID=UPI00034D2AE9|nr:cytosine permease [Ideonella sp. B508-1]
MAQSHAPDLQDQIEDHALEAVPESARQSWLTLSWNTAGIVTTLVQLFFGALVSLVAGFQIALLAGLCVTVVGALLGWGVGHVAYRSGLSSTVMARRFGFGEQGSAVASLIFAFMIIGFLALENALLYKGLLFYFGWPDNLGTRVGLYGGLTLAWVALTAFGFNWVSRVSSVTLLAFLAVLAWITASVLGAAAMLLPELLHFPTQLPDAALLAMGVHGDAGKFIFAVNVLIGSAGALALVDADLGRYARRSRDIGLAALVGNLAMDVLMLAIGAAIMHVGAPRLAAFYAEKQGISLAQAQQLVLASPDAVAAAFIVFGGALGTVLMVLAQGKAQVLNTYSASLSLSNLFDAVGGWRPGRLWCVVLANVIGLVMLYGQLLALVNAWITLLGVLTTCFAGVILADYHLMGGRRRAASHREAVNWSGVVATGVATWAATGPLTAWVPVPFASALLVSVLLYAGLRRLVLRPAPAALNPN